GADYLAPYYNRMENLTIDSQKVIEHLAAEIKRTNAKSKILAASFKNVAQINQACQMGAQAVTIAPELVTQGLAMPAIQKAVTDFQEDWVAVFGVETV
ncbi:transaldolase family protein, partial [Enterococcus faecium]